MRVLKSFGSGVILATAFIHMLYPALEILSSPCLPAFFTEIYPAFAIVLALFAILLMQLVDIFGTHFRLKYRRRRKSSDGNGFTMDVGPAGIRTAANETGNGNGELKVDPSELCDHEHHHIENHNHHHPSHPQHNHSHSHDHHHSSHTQHNHVHHHDRHNSGSLDEETQLDGNHGDGCCQTAAVVAMMSSGDDCPDVLKSKKWNLYLLETVIGIHSVIIGFALGVKRETAEFTTLLIALVFHQFFEGFALGTLASALHLQPRILITLILVYCLTTPVGTAIGVILTAAINPNPNDVASLVVTGVLDSLAAGILVLCLFIFIYRFLPHRHHESLHILNLVPLLRI
ncbi:Zinc/iron permease [Paraphysoderma sedebokerense]|nr:Zinc/iron permease [Paraphysoderma sedebokerense]